MSLWSCHTSRLFQDSNDGFSDVWWRLWVSFNMQNQIHSIRFCSSRDYRVSYPNKDVFSDFSKIIQALGKFLKKINFLAKYYFFEKIEKVKCVLKRGFHQIIVFFLHVSKNLPITWKISRKKLIFSLNINFFGKILRVKCILN